MELEKHNMEMDKVSDSMSGLLQDACVIIEQARTTAYRAVNETLIKRNWLLGMRIQHEVLKDKRAEYGEQVIRVLAKNLTLKYGAGYSRNNLYRYLSFYKSFPNIFQSVSGKLLTDTTDNIFHAVSRKSEIVPSLTGQSKTVPSVMGLSDQSDLYNIMASTYPLRLSWTHYSIILQESNAEARAWYENEAANEMWSTRTLQRNISSQYYHRMLQSQDKAAVHDEMVKLTKPLQDKLEYLKNPVVAEFLGFKNNTEYTESRLEQSIIDHLVPFLMELGKGFAFVDRQKHIHTEKEDYYIDLVFYNYHLRCFVLIDLKTKKLTYQDVGQMDMYVKMYDELVRPEGHNPTIGLLLCSDTDEDVAHYSVLNGSDQLYAAKYLTYMPTQEELRREIEQQKEFYRLQNGE
jgi:predicted nuclease of restriction endonuclease-like (RecB) superfamily